MIGKSVQHNPIGMLVHALIQKNLMKKANEEKKRNQQHHAELFDKYHKDRFDEKKYLEMIRAQLEEKKERREMEKEHRQHAYNEEKEKRQLLRDIEKTKATTAITHEASSKDKQRDAIAKSFANPTDAMRYMLDPEKYKGKIEMFDNSSLAKKIWGKVKEKMGGTYTPIIKTRLK
jgi:AAA+ ATPase superfamily predicted ATPase